MRKPRDFDSEMKALNERAKVLKARKLHQLGELVIATGADALPIEQLAGALLMAVETKDAAAKEAQHATGAAFFQRTGRARSGARRHNDRDATGGGGAEPAAADAPAS